MINPNLIKIFIEQLKLKFKWIKLFGSWENLWKNLRTNHSKFVTKNLREAMLRTKLGNQFSNAKPNQSWLKRNKQRNICLSRQDIRRYYETMDLKDITDNKNFGASVKPFFSNKIKLTEYITLEENSKVIINTNHDFLINAWVWSYCLGNN